MTTIKVDSPTGAMAVRELLDSPPGDVIEFLGSSGEVLGTLFIKPSEALADEYVQLVADAEANLETLLRVAATPSEQCATTAEVLNRARAHAAE